MISALLQKQLENSDNSEPKAKACENVEMEDLSSGHGQGASSSPKWSRLEVVQCIATFLSLEELKTVRLLNRTWFFGTILVWRNRCRIVHRDIIGIRKFLSTASASVKLLPYTVHQWSFQGQTIPKLMDADEGHCEQELMKPFWTSIKILSFDNWTKPRLRYNWRQRRYLEEQVLIKTASVHHLMDMYKQCTNLTKMIIHFPLLGKLKGAYIGPLQFPQLEKLQSFELYWAGEPFNENQRGERGANNDFEALIQANIRVSQERISFPRPVAVRHNRRRRRRKIKTGGRPLVMRILDHSPNLTYFSVDSGTLISTRVENWVAFIMLEEKKKLPIAPSMTRLKMSVPLTAAICQKMKNMTWALRSLHLRILPGDDYRISGNDLHDLIQKFKNTLEHLELIYLRRDICNRFPNSDNLIQLRSIEMWGFTGSFDFLKELPKLQQAIIGGYTGDGSFRKAQQYFINDPLPNVQVQVLSQEDFYRRLNQGASFPVI